MATPMHQFDEPLKAAFGPSATWETDHGGRTHPRHAGADIRHL